MSTRRRTVDGVPLLVMRAEDTGHTQVMARSGAAKLYLGEFFPQVIDTLHLHLCELSPGIEVWEPDRPWPWKTHNTTVETEGQALRWLLDRAAKRGDLR